MEYFKIFAKRWTFQNKIISANIDLFIGKKIIVADEPFSLTDSIQNLLKSISISHIPQNNNPLLVCSCGNKSCAGFDFEIIHLHDKVIISKFKMIQDIDCQGKLFEISRDTYIKEIINLCKDYLDFCNILKDLDHDDFSTEDIKEKIKLNEKTPENKTLNAIEIENIIKTYSTNDIARFVKKFNWKLNDIFVLLHSDDEVIRYKCVELLNVLQYSPAVKIIIEKLKYETQDNVKYAMYKFLSCAGVLKNMEIMDELYSRRLYKYKCKKLNLHLARKETRNTLFMLSFLLENEDQKINLFTLDSIDSCEIEKNTRMCNALSWIITNKRKNTIIRKKAIDIMHKIDNKPLLEVVQDKKESDDIRCWCIQKISQYGRWDVISTLQQIFNDKEESQAIRNLCKQYLTKIEFYRKIKIHHLVLFMIILLLGVISFLPLLPIIKVISIIMCISVMVVFVFYELS